MKTCNITASEIQYDTDGVSVEHLRNEGAYLPDTLCLEVDWDGTEEGSHTIADAISDVTGFCVLSFNFNARTGA